MWCASLALHHNHAIHGLCVHRKNGAVTMNIPVEQEPEEGTRRWKKILFAVFDELFVENLGSSVAKCVLAARC